MIYNQAPFGGLLQYNNMLVKKIERGLYDVLDKDFNHYRVEDSSREHPQHEVPSGSKGSDWKWGIWEQSGGEWIYLDGNPSMAECLEVINTWAMAQEYLK